MDETFKDSEKNTKQIIISNPKKVTTHNRNVKMSNGEKLCADALSSKGIVYDYQSLVVIRTNRWYDFKFEYEGFTYILEYDGKQHFQMVSLFHKKLYDFIMQQIRDIEKMEFALNNGYRVIRIDYTCEKLIQHHLDKALKLRNSIYYSNESFYSYLYNNKLNSIKNQLNNNALIKVNISSPEDFCIELYEIHSQLDIIENKLIKNLPLREKYSLLIELVNIQISTSKLLLKEETDVQMLLDEQLTYVTENFNMIMINNSRFVSMIEHNKPIINKHRSRINKLNNIILRIDRIQYKCYFIVFNEYPDNKYVSDILLDSSKIECQFDCELCYSQDNPIVYCNHGCYVCDILKENIKTVISNNSKRQYKKILYLKDAAKINTSINDNRLVTYYDDILLGDRYYLITLLSNKSDGNECFIRSELIRNFNRLFAPSIMVKFYKYSIISDEKNNLKLIGLIRQQGTGVKCISEKSNFFKNNFKIKKSNLSIDRPKFIKKYTKFSSFNYRPSQSDNNFGYSGFTYQTNKQEIIHVWEQINITNNSVGDNLDYFLQK